MNDPRHDAVRAHLDLLFHRQARTIEAVAGAVALRRDLPFGLPEGLQGIRSEITRFGRGKYTQGRYVMLGIDRRADIGKCLCRRFGPKPRVEQGNPERRRVVRFAGLENIPFMQRAA